MPVVKPRWKHTKGEREYLERRQHLIEAAKAGCREAARELQKNYRMRVYTQGEINAYVDTTDQ